MSQYRIERLGHQGDGIAEGPVYAPLTLPGELVEGQADGERLTQVKILAASEARQRPPCPHYRLCGGCVLQHARDDFVADWKAKSVLAALDAQGISGQIAAVVTSPPASRRRATLHGRRGKAGPLVGFHVRGSDSLTEIPGCLVLAPGLLAMLPALRALTEMAGTRTREIDFALTLADNGLDLSVTGARDLAAPEIAAVLALCGASLARLVWNGEVLAQDRVPQVTLGGVAVDLPPGAFLQATAHGEAALVAEVRRLAAGAGRIADLFAGIGTFALPLSDGAEVHAVEASETMVAALLRAARGQARGHAVSAEARDLFRRPLMPDELAGFDVVVVDPPRAGATAQIEQIAKSTVRRVISVSCSPASFARDARVLIDAGFVMGQIVVVDQFRWSSHVELVTEFRRN